MRSLRVCVLYCIAAIFLAWIPAAKAQVVSAGLTGIVQDQSGNPVSGVIVTAVHEPTGTSYKAMTRGDGRYNFRSLIVGGPYRLSVSPSGYKPTERTGVVTQLGENVDVNFQIESGTEVVALEKFVVEADPNELDSTSTGAATVLSGDRLAGKPTTQRSLADVISASPFVTLRAQSGDREEAQISAVGQNARFNSIMIDGARINDQFGLNFTGLASFFNPLSLDTIEQLSVSISPYDVRQSGFTGASINAVTKSGTNKFRGTLYYMFSGDHLAGVQMQGEDAGTKATSGVNFVPKLERTTYGFTLGGPIWKNKIFFFTNYEKFKRVQPPSQTGLTVSPSDPQIATIKSRLDQLNQLSGKKFDWGDLGGNASNITTDEKKLAKIDWNISSTQRLSVRYSTTEGTVPQFGGFTQTTSYRGATLSGQPVTAFTSHFYAQARKEEVYAAQLFSQWTPDFKTEIKYSKTKQQQMTPVNLVAPLINIYGVTGVNQQGQTVNNGVILLGTEFSRQGNQLFIDTESYSASGDYFWKNFTFTGGFDREQNDFVNLFRQGSYGEFDFASPAAFAAGTVAGFLRNAYDPSQRPVADISDYTVTGVFGQAKWDINPSLNVVAGLRVDLVGADAQAPFNQRFFNDTGFRNDGSVDGVHTVSPRVGFNWSPLRERKLQVRGGVGRFEGRAPWVIFSNSFNNPGVGTFALPSTPIPTLESYLTSFDQASPIGTGTDTFSNRRQINFNDDKTKFPAVWRGNLAADYRLPWLDSVLSFEVVQTYSADALFITNENLKATGVGIDGRTVFAGDPTLNTSAGAAAARFPNYLGIYRVQNRSKGDSQYASISIDRPMRGHWAFNLSYTRGDSKDIQVWGNTTAESQWRRNAVFNQNAPEMSHSDFEIRDRIQATYTREFEFIKKSKTVVSVYYEGRTGNPYSWVYASDLNNDGRNDNDLIAVPSSENDARFDFSGMTATQVQAYFETLKSTGLNKFAGGYAPRNAFTQPWINRLDLHLSQNIPIYRPAELELFLDFTNLGSFLSKGIFNYYQRTTLVESDTFWRRQFGGATYDSVTGKIKPTYGTPTGIVYDNGQSRWRIQIGARLKF